MIHKDLKVNLLEMVTLPDKTISFKTDEELSEKVKNLIESSGLTAKDWFNKAVALSEMQSVKQGSTDYASDLTELEAHTTRIYELVASMVQKSIYLRDNAVKDLETKLEQQRDITADYQIKIKEVTDKRDQALNDLETSQQEQNDLEKQLAELREALETNKLLVAEYQEKNDTLNGLVTKYQGYANENEQLKETLSNERSSHQSGLNDLAQQNNEKQAIIAQLEQQITSLTEAHKIATERLTEQRDVQQEKALLQAERSQQRALAKANSEYTSKLKELYDQLANERKNYDAKEQQLQQKIQDLQKIIDKKK